MENKVEMIGLDDIKKAIKAYGTEPSAKRLEDILCVSAALSLVEQAEVIKMLADYARIPNGHGMSKAELKSAIKDYIQNPGEVENITGYNGLPVIHLYEDTDIGCQPRLRHEVSDDAFAHIKADDTFVVRGGELGTVRDTGESVFSFEAAETRHITSALARKAVFIEQERKSIEVHANPPHWIAEDILSGQNLSAMPTLKLIVSHPIYAAGDILDFKGFNRESGYYRPESAFVEPIYPDTSEQALEVLKDLFCDFPFESDADYENALAVPLTMILRPNFPPAELVPLCAINAASPGTGKSALAKALFSPLLPTEAAVTPLSNDKEEIRKAVFTKLREGKNYVIFDNLDQNKNLDSGLIASVISEPYHTDRLLGGNSSGTFQNHLVPLYTGNNIQASPELVDRGFLVSLISPAQRSAERDFKHKELFAYARQQRPQTLGALLFMIQKWKAEGEPMSEHRHRMSYWAKCIGGVLTVNGLGEAFLSNMKQFRRETDSESPQWARAFAAIYEKFSDKPWAVKDVFTILSYEKSYYSGRSHVHEKGENLLGKLYTDVPNSDHARRIRVAKLVKTRVGQTLGGFKLESADTHQNRQQYKIIKVGN